MVLKFDAIELRPPERAAALSGTSPARAENQSQQQPTKPAPQSAELSRASHAHWGSTPIPDEVRHATMYNSPPAGVRAVGRNKEAVYVPLRPQGYAADFLNSMTTSFRIRPSMDAPTAPFLGGGR